MKRAFVNESLTELERRASFMAVDAADHITGKSAQTLPVEVLYPGTDTWVSIGDATDMGHGLYSPTGLGVAAQTVGTMFFHIPATADTDPVDFAMTIEAAIDLSNLDAAVSTRATPGDIPTVPTAQQVATALVDEVVEDNGQGTTWSLKETLRLLLAFMVGERAGGGTTLKSFKIPGGTKTRIAMLTDDAGNSLATHTLDAGDVQ